MNIELIIIICMLATAAAIVGLKLTGRDNRTANEKAFDTKLERLQAWINQK